MDRYKDVLELLDSIDEDKSSWTKRSVLKLLSMQTLFKGEIKQIEKYILSITNKTKWGKRIGTGISGVGSITTGISFFRELIIKRDGSIEPSALFTGVVSTAVTTNLILTSILGYTQSQDYENKLNLANEIVSDYYYLIHEIESQIYRKAEQRTPVIDLLKHINKEHERLIKKASTKLGISSLKPYLDEQKQIRRFSKDIEMHNASSDDHDNYDSMLNSTPDNSE